MNKRWVAAVGIAVGVGTCAAAAAHGLPGHVDLFPSPTYVTLQGSSVVEELPTQRLYRNLPGAHFDAVNEDGTLLLVSSSTRPEAYLVATRTGQKLATFEVGPVPQGVAFDPSGSWALADSSRNGTVSVIDVSTRRIVRTITLGRQPWGVGFGPRGRHAYVALQGGHALAVLDTRSWRPVRTIAMPQLMPHVFDFAPDGKTLWVRGLNGHVAAVDLRTDTVLGVTAVGPSHAGVVTIPGNPNVFTGGIAGHVVDAVDSHSFKVIAQIPVGQGPHDVDASPDGRWVYAGVTATGTLAVIDARTRKVVGQVQLRGVLPLWIAIARGVRAPFVSPAALLAAVVPAAGGQTAGAYAFDAQRGASLFAADCSACHQPSGTGLPGAFPPLKGNPVVLDADPTQQLDAILHGLHGRRVMGTVYPGAMPSFADTLTDAEIADVANHERAAWGNHGKPVTARQVHALRTGN